jgi:hypothetical protein
MSSIYEIRIKDHDGETVAILTDGKDSIWRSLYFVHTENAPGQLRLELSGDNTLADEIEDDYQIEIYRSDPSIDLDKYIEWEGLVVTTNPETLDNGDSVIALYGTSYLDLVDRRWIWYPADTVYTSKNGIGETVIKSYVEENAGPSAISPPRLEESGVTSGLTVETDQARGGTWSGSRTGRNVLEVIREVALSTGLAYDVIGTGPGTFEFRVYDGQRGEDRTSNGLDPNTGMNRANNAPITFALNAGNMARPSYSRSASEEVNAVLVMGQGTGSARTVVSVSDATAQSRSPWARRETVRNGSQEATVAGLTSIGEQTIEENMIQERLSFTVLQLGSLAYGKHYSHGDLVTVKYRDIVADKKLSQVRVTVSSNAGGEEIEVEFADVLPLNLNDPRKKSVYQIQNLIRRVEIIESRDPGVGATVPDSAPISAVKVSSTANVAALSGTGSLDGVAYVANDRLLLKDQTSTDQNGLWIASTGAWQRADDTLVGGMLILVSEGTTNGNTVWMLTTNDPITPGVTLLSFSQDILPLYLTQTEANGIYSLLGHVHSAGDITSGILALARGGTGSNLSATGPGFLKQASGGAVVTVAVLGQTDIPVMTGATGIAAGQRGAVPQPVAGDNVKFLRGDATWAVPTAAVMTGATGVSGGTAGSVPAPVAGDNVKFLRGDATWSNPSGPVMTGATGALPGTQGEVPAPGATDNVKFLKGDATWATPVAVMAISQTEIDFGSSPLYSKEFSVVDGAIAGTEQIICTVSYDQPTSKVADEPIFDELKLVAKSVAGGFTLFAEGLEGRVYGAFKINYMVG